MHNTLVTATAPYNSIFMEELEEDDAGSFLVIISLDIREPLYYVMFCVPYSFISLSETVVTMETGRG
jgi:hypothetical protein